VHKEFDRIKKDATCSDFMLDLVQIIEWRLLRVKPELRDTIDTVVKEFEQMYKRCCQDTNYCMSRSKTALESPLRMDDIMEVTRTPRPSFDMTDRLSLRSDRSSRSPQAMHGRRKRSQTLESEKFHRDGNQRLGVETSHLTASFTTPSSLPSSAVSEPGSDIFSEMAGETVFQTPEVTNVSLPVELDVHETSNSGPEISKETRQPTMSNATGATTSLIPGIVVTEDTNRSQEPPHADPVSKTNTVPQTLNADDSNEEISKKQQAPNLPEPITTGIAMKLSKRRRFKTWVKTWVSQVLDSILPEKD
jgi:hypothetical protein